MDMQILGHVCFSENILSDNLIKQNVLVCYTRKIHAYNFE